MGFEKSSSGGLSVALGLDVMSSRLGSQDGRCLTAKQDARLWMNRLPFLQLALLTLFLIAPSAVAQPVTGGAQTPKIQDSKEQTKAASSKPANIENQDINPSKASTNSLPESSPGNGIDKQQVPASDTGNIPQTPRRPASEFRRPTKPTAAEALEPRPPKPKFLDSGMKKAFDILDLTFDDLAFEIKDNEDFRWSMITPEIHQYDGAKVTLRGYIRPSFSQRKLKQFVFVRDNQECCFGPGAALYDCVLVKMAEGAETDFTVRPVTIEGEFYLRKYAGPDGNVWAIYRLKDGRVK